MFMLIGFLVFLKIFNFKSTSESSNNFDDQSLKSGKNQLVLHVAIFVPGLH
jgi:hypothetical protein